MSDGRRTLLFALLDQVRSKENKKYKSQQINFILFNEIHTSATVSYSGFHTGTSNFRNLRDK